MKGEAISDSELSNCAPVLTVNDLLGWWDYKKLPGSISKEIQANPCGLIAKYQFSDTFISVTEINGSKTFQILQDSIVRPFEHSKFKQNSEIALHNGYWWNPVDVNLINWFSMETLPDFQKLYGRIEGTLQ